MKEGNKPIRDMNLNERLAFSLGSETQRQAIKSSSNTIPITMKVFILTIQGSYLIEINTIDDSAKNVSEDSTKNVSDDSSLFSDDSTFFSDDNTKNVSWEFESPNAGNEMHECMKISGIEIPTKMEKVTENHGGEDEHYDRYQSFGNHKQRAAAMNAVIAHLFEIFPNCQVKDLEIQYSGSLTFDYRTALSSIKSVERLDLRGHACMNDIIKTVVSNIRITESFNDDMLCHSTEFIYDKLECSKEIICYYAPWMLPETLLKLNCAHMNLKNTHFTEVDIMEFLRKWKNSNGEEMKRIKYIRLQFRNDEINSLNLEEFDGQPWDPQTRARNFISPTEILLNCARGTDIQRSDGLIATILQNLKYPHEGFHFCVWHNRFPAEPDNDI